LYIVEVNTSGVEMFAHGEGREPTRWKDYWTEWRERLSGRGVSTAGRSRRARTGALR
jgi:hypothetical protein